MNYPPGCMGNDFEEELLRRFAPFFELTLQQFQRRASPMMRISVEVVGEPVGDGENTKIGIVHLRIEDIEEFTQPPPEALVKQ